MKFVLVILISICSVTLHSQVDSIIVRNDLKKFYDKYKLDGTFVLYNQNQNTYIVYNQQLINKPFTPASSFKICNSLIGLEIGVISDENYVIKWDSVIRPISAWNQDHDMKTAFKNSTVWYYQELARRVGGEKMKFWLDKANYGNADTTGGIDQFWLTGRLRITPIQQIEFLRSLHDNMLPFSQRSIDIVKKIMIAKETPDFVLRAKTGWGEQDNEQIGWYVGYFETKNNTYYFANCIQTSDSENKDFAKARINIVYQIFEELKIIPNETY